MVFGGAAIHSYRLFRQRKRGRAFAERIANLREKKVRLSFVRSLTDPRFDYGAGPFPVARFDQPFGHGGPGNASGRRHQDTEQSHHFL